MKKWRPRYKTKKLTETQKNRSLNLKQILVWRDHEQHFRKWLSPCQVSWTIRVSQFKMRPAKCKVENDTTSGGLPHTCSDMTPHIENLGRVYPQKNFIFSLCGVWCAQKPKTITNWSLWHIFNVFHRQFTTVHMSHAKIIHVIIKLEWKLYKHSDNVHPARTIFDFQ